MPSIRPLPPEVASKIAAGEVVERPASVVKELVENSIDAGAQSITVDIEDGGRRLIAVSDDGSGMDAEDAVLSVKRYATSKICDDSDLFRLTTMGFRGEALHAISMVSRFVIETKVEGALEGTRLEAEGERISVRAAGCPCGTRIEIRDLFFNTPARKKFLKSSTVEFGHINVELVKIALAHPQISFELNKDGKRAWFYHSVVDQKERLRLIASAEECDKLVGINEEGFGLSLSGWIGGDLITRASPKDFHVFVNKRPVRDRLLMHGVTAGFGETLERGRYPVAVIFLQIDPAMVDVNVHPTKREVRFENGPAVHDFLQTAIRKSLGSARTERAFGSFNQSWSGHAQSFERRGAEDTSSTAQLDQRRSVLSQSPPLTFDGESSSTFRILGQLDRAFILCEDDDNALMVIDQHAAHERLGFEELKRQYADGKIEQQGLLIPVTLSLNPREMAVFESSREVLERAGFSVDPFGGNEIAIKAVPALLTDADIGSLFEKMFHELDELGSSVAIDEKVEQMFSLIACHRQVRAGDWLESAEMHRLVDEVLNNKIDSCPHGRPAVVRFERKDIDKWFKR